MYVLTDRFGVFGNIFKQNKGTFKRRDGSPAGWKTY